MTFKSLSFIVLSLTFLTSCYTNLKELDREVRVRIVDNMSITIENNGNSTFTEYLNEAQYREEFLRGLRSDLQGKKVIIDNQNPEFEVVLEKLSITESTRMDTIKDASSPDNGKVFELTTLDLDASGSMRKISDGKMFTWSADKSKSESTTSLRSAAQIAAGENKDKNEYREKAFDSGESGDLTEKVGGRAGSMIVRDLIGEINE